MMEGARQIPRVGELVIANVSKVMQFGAYCRLPEYGDLEVFLPIREVSSGWIKNIREFIHEGQKVVCEVSFYDKEKNSIDISLKRVTPNKAKVKIRAYNLEKRLAALFQQAIKSSKEPNGKALEAAALSEFGSYTALMENANNDTQEFKGSTLPVRFKQALVKVLEANRKEKKFVVSYLVTLSTFDTMKGASELRALIGEIKQSGIEISYISAPKYRFMAEGKDYADAESKINRAQEMIKERLKRGIFEIEKEKLRKEREDIMAEI